MSSSRLKVTAVSAAAALVLTGLGAGLGTASAEPKGGSAAAKPAAKDKKPITEKAVFFASDGMRQDKVQRYADQGVMPTMKGLLKKGVHAAGGGLLTQAPPNTGAGWYTLATGAWPAVHGSTNNTFHKNGDPFGNRTAAFDPGVLQAESIAQSAERDGLKVAQVEWAGGRNASIQGPTIDFQTFLSGRGVATNYVSPADNLPFAASLGLQFDQHVSGAGRRLDRRTDVTQPGHGDAPARPRRRRRQVRPERLPLRQHQRRHHQLRPRAVLPDQGRRRQRRRPRRG